jgi:hypothetical protein
MWNTHAPWPTNSIIKFQQTYSYIPEDVFMKIHSYIDFNRVDWIHKIGDIIIQQHNRAMKMNELL